MAYTDDPVLRLLPEPPASFLVLPDEEQRWRGRLFIAMYGAGYPIDYAWWFVLWTNNAEWEAWAKDFVSQIPDDPREYAAMIQGRQRFDAELARQAQRPQ